MKRIILSEGKNDTIFLKELLTKKLTIFKENEILFFDQNAEETYKNTKFLEDKYFDKLDSEWMPFKLLVKSEGGKTKIIGTTISKMVYLCKKGYDPIILIDLDGGKIECFIDKFKEKLIDRFKNNNLTITSNELHKIDDALMHSMRLSQDNKLIGTIYITGFYQTLERTTGIDNTLHTDDNKRIISQKYMETSRIHEIFNKALSNS